MILMLLCRIVPYIAFIRAVLCQVVIQMVAKRVLVNRQRGNVHYDEYCWIAKIPTNVLRLLCFNQCVSLLFIFPLKHLLENGNRKAALRHRGQADALHCGLHCREQRTACLRLYIIMYLWLPARANPPHMRNYSLSLSGVGGSPQQPQSLSTVEATTKG